MNFAKWCCALLVLLAVSAFSILPAHAQSPGDLRKDVERWIVAATREEADWVGALVLPGHTDWFRESFGDEAGAALSFQYESSTDEWSTVLPRLFADWATNGKPKVEVYAAERAEGQPFAAVLLRAQRPLRLFSVSVTRRKEKESRELGFFVHVGGQFRFLGRIEILAFGTDLRLVLLASSTKVQKAKLVKNVPPKYPRVAIEAKTEGNVLLQAIVSQDGTLREIRALSGDPLFVGAALEAIHQWRYEPMQIDGKPVAVVTSIEVRFFLVPSH